MDKDEGIVSFDYICKDPAFLLICDLYNYAQRLKCALAHGTSIKALPDEAISMLRYHSRVPSQAQGSDCLPQRRAVTHPSLDFRATLLMSEKVAC